MKAKPGTELHRLIKQWTGQDVSLSCRCMAWIRKMDVQGPAWCRKHVREIAAHLRAEAKKRNWWKYPAVVPGARFVLRRMVLLAVKRSERNVAQD